MNTNRLPVFQIGSDHLSDRVLHSVKRDKTNLTIHRTIEVKGDKMKERFTILMILAFAVAVLAPAAHANMVLSLDDPMTLGIDVIIADGMPVGTWTALGLSNATDNSGLAGVINFNGALAATVWTVNITTGVSKPVIGGPAEAKLDLNSVNVTGGAGSLAIMLTDTGFSLPAYVGANAFLTSEIGGTTNGKVQLWQTLDRDNNEFAIGTSNSVMVTSGLLGPGAFSNTTTGFAPVAGLFSLTEKVLITHTGAGQITSFDAESTVVPVPAAVLLGLLGMGVAGLKLRKYA